MAIQNVQPIDFLGTMDLGYNTIACYKTSVIGVR